jgi:hypothetical protein
MSVCVIVSILLLCGAAKEGELQCTCNVISSRIEPNSPAGTQVIRKLMNCSVPPGLNQVELEPAMILAYSASPAYAWSSQLHG